MERLWRGMAPVFSEYPVLRNVVLWENLSYGAIVFYGLMVGCIIWSGSARGCKIARTFLLIRLSGSIGITAISLFMLRDLPPKIFEDQVAGAVVAECSKLIFFLGWWFYFKTSKRVKNTYGDKSGLG